jgi:hypothetical protein
VRRKMGEVGEDGDREGSVLTSRRGRSGGRKCVRGELRGMEQRGDGTTRKSVGQSTKTTGQAAVRELQEDARHAGQGGDGEDGGGNGGGTLATGGAGAPRGERGRAHPGDRHLTGRGIGSGQERLRHEATQDNGGQHDHH